MPSTVPGAEQVPSDGVFTSTPCKISFASSGNQKTLSPLDGWKNRGSQKEAELHGLLGESMPIDGGGGRVMEKLSWGWVPFLLRGRGQERVVGA